jgi:hypothetical protein
MKAMTKLFGLGAVGAGVYAALRAKQRRAALHQENQDAIEAFDYGDLEAPIVITEEVVVVTEAEPYDIEMVLIPADEPQDQARNENRSDPSASSFDMPGRDAGPR